MMRKKLKLKLALATLLGLGASVAVAQVMVEDSDGDGMFSMEELVATYPAMTEDLFVVVDANEDGAVDAEELAQAQAAGLLAG